MPKTFAIQSNFLYSYMCIYTFYVIIYGTIKFIKKIFFQLPSAVIILTITIYIHKCENECTDYEFIMNNNKIHDIFKRDAIFNQKFQKFIRPAAGNAK